MQLSVVFYWFRTTASRNALSSDSFSHCVVLCLLQVHITSSDAEEQYKFFPGGHVCAASVSPPNTTVCVPAFLLHIPGTIHFFGPRVVPHGARRVPVQEPLVGQFALRQQLLSEDVPLDVHVVVVVSRERHAVFHSR